MHKALYREYRPLVFDDVIGQEHIIRTLKNQIKNDNLSHAYLFCGTRGTGKTTTAKILSRAVNCISKDKEVPCNECEMCVGILDGSNLDVIEIDAASNNSVDDIRELRETVKYTPNSSRYKVYIIDEVHMLSQGAFNALLKTLEEPPSYVIFILATTEPNKIPATILSRCQRFDFKRVAIETIMDRMRDICSKEDVEIEEDALRIVARNGQGSVRDALSILDKCLAFSSEKLTAENVLDLLGAAEPSQLFEFAKSIIDSDIQKSMKLIDDYYMWGKDLKNLVQDTSLFFRSLMMVKIFNKADEFIDLTKEYTEKILILSKEVEMKEIIRILGILSELSNSLKYSTNQRITVEIYVMKLSSPSTDSSEESIVKRIENIEKIIEDGKINIKSNIIMNANTVDSKIVNNNLSPQSVKNMDIAETSKEEKNKEIPDNIDDEDIQDIIRDWGKLMDKMKADKKTPLRAFLSENRGLRYKNEILYVIIHEGLAFSLDRLNEKENYNYIKNSMRNVFGLNIEPRFILEKDLDKMNFDNNDISKEDEDNEAVKILKDRLGDKLKIEEK